MKVYIYSQHIIALIISLGQYMCVQNVILPRGIYFLISMALVFDLFDYRGECSGRDGGDNTADAGGHGW